MKESHVYKTNWCEDGDNDGKVYGVEVENENEEIEATYWFVTAKEQDEEYHRQTMSGN